MGNYTTLRALFSAIATSIRGKTGSSATIIAKNFPEEIDAIQTGSTPTGTVNISITENGTTTHGVSAYANAKISVNVQAGGPGISNIYSTILPRSAGTTNLQTNAGNTYAFYTVEITDATIGFKPDFFMVINEKQTILASVYNSKAYDQSGTAHYVCLTMMDTTQGNAIGEWQVYNDTTHTWKIPVPQGNEPTADTNWRFVAGQFPENA